MDFSFPICPFAELGVQTQVQSPFTNQTGARNAFSASAPGLGDWEAHAWQASFRTFPP